MKIMSLNCRVLARPQKRSTIKRLVDLEHPDILLLQETLGVGDVLKCRLESWFTGWNFETLDIRGRSRGLAIGWNVRNVKVLNLWGMDSVLGLTFKALELVDTFTIFNVYGPYLNRIPFLDNLFNNSLLRGDMVIIGRDLNFSLG